MPNAPYTNTIDDALLGGHWQDPDFDPKQRVTLAEYPPVQGGKSFDMSNVVKEFIGKPRQ